MTTLSDLLGAVANPAQPFLTHYDGETGERVELSATTTANWVAKTSNFLVETLDAEAGVRVRLALPTHWESFVWMLSAWNVGAVVTDHDADIAVVGPELVATEDQKVALSLRPMGLPFATPPSDFIDYNAEVPGHSDHFESFDPPAAHDLALDLEATLRTHATALDWATPVSARVLLEPGTTSRDCRAVIAACRGNGSLVIVANATDEQRRRIAATEHATTL